MFSVLYHGSLRSSIDTPGFLLNFLEAQLAGRLFAKWKKVTKTVKRLFTNTTRMGSSICATNQYLSESVKTN